MIGGIREVPILLVAVALLLAGAIKGRFDGGLSDPMVASLMTAGLIAFGAWLHAEARHDHHNHDAEGRCEP